MTAELKITLRLDSGLKHASAPVVARQERRGDQARKKGGMFHRFAKISAVRRLRKMRHLATRQGMVNTGRAGIQGFVSGASLGGKRVAAAGALGGMVIMAGALAIMATARLITGQSFENMGANLNKALLGDLDDQARAKVDTRNFLEGKEVLMRHVKEHGIQGHVTEMAKDLAELRLRAHKGRSLFEEDERFQVNSTLDILIVRARDKFVESWKAVGGDTTLQELRLNLQAVHELAKDESFLIRGSWIAGQAAAWAAIKR